MVGDLHEVHQAMERRSSGRASRRLWLLALTAVTFRAERHPLSPNGSMRPGFLDAAAAIGNSPTANPWSDDGSVESFTSRVTTDAPVKPAIHPMPEKPLHLLKRLVSLLKVNTAHVSARRFDGEVGQVRNRPHSSKLDVVCLVIASTTQVVNKVADAR